MKAILHVLMLLAMLAGSGCNTNSESQTGNEPGEESDSSGVSEQPQEHLVQIVFLEFRNLTGNSASAAIFDSLESRLHGQNAWLHKGQQFTLQHADSSLGNVPISKEVHRFFSTRKVTELRHQDAKKISITWEKPNEEDLPQVSFLVYQNQNNNWRKIMNPGVFTFKKGNLIDWLTDLVVILSYK